MIQLRCRIIKFRSRTEWAQTEDLMLGSCLLLLPYYCSTLPLLLLFSVIAPTFCATTDGSLTFAYLMVLISATNGGR